MTEKTANPTDLVTQAIKEFDFDDYGLDETDPNHEDAEWVPDLVAAIVAALQLGEREKEIRESVAADIEAYQPAAHPVSCPPAITYAAAMETAARIARDGADRG